MELPLGGVRVIELGQIYAVPYCTMQLARMGAEVIKVEPPEIGEYLRYFGAPRGATSQAFMLLNAGKKSVTLNLKESRAHAVLMRLLEGADVLVENYSRGVMESFELGYGQLSARFPRLVYASVKGYSPGSPWERLAAMDSTVQAACGCVSVTGFADGPGVKTPATFIDMSTGSHLVSGILAALLRRELSGRGQKVEVAMFDVAIPAMTTPIAAALDGRTPKRVGNRHGRVCPSNVYQVQDGQVMILCVTEAHWRAVAKLMDRADLLGEPRFKDHTSRMQIADEVDGLVEAWTRSQSREQLMEKLIGAGVPAAPVLSVTEAVALARSTTSGVIADCEFPGHDGASTYGLPIKFSDLPRLPTGRAPLIGEHTAEILGQLGLSAAELQELRRDGVI
jgi:crotonobetainyl-CoA:carnitine CoA-transferase CaiB-like acyl-CoA transferase